MTDGYKLSYSILSFYAPMFILVGTIGNGLTLAVLLTKSYRRKSTSMYLIAMTIFDTFVLLFSLFFKWINNSFNFDIRTTPGSNLICKLHVFLVYASFQTCSWILVAITIERLGSIVRPHRIADVSTRSRAVKCILIIMFLALLINSHFLYGYNLHFFPPLGSTLCMSEVGSQYEYFVQFIWSWVDFLLVFALPCAIILPSNIFIAVKLRGSHLFRKNSASRGRNSVSSNPRSRSSMNSRGSTSSETSKCSTRRRSGFIYFTRIMILLNITFILSVGPVCIFNIGQSYWFPGDEMTTDKHADLKLTATIVHMLMYLNNTINFLIYVLPGLKFRQELHRVLCTRLSKTLYPSQTNCQLHM